MRRRIGVGLWAAALLVLGIGLSAPIARAQGEYPLDANDKVRVTVFGEEDLTGEFEIDGTGSLSFPLIGTVRASGLTQRDLEAELTRMLSDGYLVSPRVSVEILSYRPFNILGEVNKPGTHPYRPGLTIIGAVAVAGDFTYRANKDRIYIIRNGLKTEAQQQDPIQPGDTIEVAERFF